MFHESFVKNTGYAVSAGCCEALSADGRARTLRSLCRALAHQAPVADVLHADTRASHFLRSVHAYLLLAEDGEPFIGSCEVRLQGGGSSLRATRRPRYWSRSEISGGAPRALRGACATASRPIPCFHRADTAARRSTRDMDLSLHLP